MAELLELGELRQHHDVPEVDVGRSGVDAELDPQGVAGCELLGEPPLGQRLLRPTRECVEISHAGR